MNGFTKDEAWALATALVEMCWGFATIRIGFFGPNVSTVSWHVREGTGLYQRHIETALALAQLHNAEIHVPDAREMRIDFTKREPA